MCETLKSLSRSLSLCLPGSLSVVLKDGFRGRRVHTFPAVRGGQRSEGV